MLKALYLLLGPTYVVVDVLVQCLVFVLVSIATSMSRNKLFET